MRTARIENRQKPFDLRALPIAVLAEPVEASWFDVYSTGNKVLDTPKFTVTSESKSSISAMATPLTAY